MLSQRMGYTCGHVALADTLGMLRVLVAVCPPPECISQWYMAMCAVTNCTRYQVCYGGEASGPSAPSA